MPINMTRYAGIYLATLVGVTLVGYALTAAFNLSPPTGVATILPPIIAAMAEGQRIARETGKQLESNVKWRAAAAMTGLVIMLNAALLLLMLAIPAMRAMLTQIPPALLGIVTLVLVALIFFANRYFLGQGLKNELKKLDGK